ncbi:putative transmembrane protein [Heterostelium album PN500]|uniref:Putative transmembrane protein n=1 Tax=Heterostelium pallidum (strain ATCC 26659 / Pp 5 / PN500) TaxID=670386 RepID=D3AXA5_HETP5|nr:putative transmembrane protein [Heterostelium album PN500]EFA86174.1 putative transmembrane protein [Heterostelium album PN500]|eukprot:XP_020438279.1 putative transmembrane protein [Heterostelium album PN500]
MESLASGNSSASGSGNEVKKINAIITGQSGMIGEGVVQCCIESDSVEKILLINRKPSGLKHEKIREIIHADFTNLTDIKDQLKGYDSVYFCAGTSSVGVDKETYHRISYEMPMEMLNTVASINNIKSKQDNDLTFIYVTGAGTDEKSWSNWAQVKAKAENHIFASNFNKTFAFRPGWVHPMPGLRNSYKIYKYIGWLYPIGRSISSNGFISLKELGNAMIKCSTSGYSKNIINGSDMAILAVFKDHKWDFITDIKQSFNQLLNNNNHDDTDNRDINNQNNETNTNFIINRINNLWSNIKQSISITKSLKASENQIKSYFGEIHDYLMSEELRLTKPFTNDKVTIENQLQDNIKELNQLTLIIKFNNILNNSNDQNHSNISDQSQNNNSSNDIDMGSENNIESQSLKEYIEKYKYSDIDYNSKDNNNNSEEKLILLLSKYLNGMKSTSTSPTSLNHNINYSISIDSNYKTKLVDFLKQSIQLNDHNREPIAYLFSAYSNGEISLLNLSNNHLETIKIDEFEFDGTLQSTVGVGEYVYIFGGINPKKYCRFSIRTKTIDFIGDINVEIENDPIAVYDGTSFIYLVNGYLLNRYLEVRVVRFDLKRQKFEYSVVHPCQITRLSYFHRKSLVFINNCDKDNLFSVLPETGESKISTLSLDLKSMDVNYCIDDNGNIYYLNCGCFYSRNLMFGNINILPGFRIKTNKFNLVYHRVSEKESYIYAMCSFQVQPNTFRHYKYSIGEKCWSPLVEVNNDQICGSCLIEFK